MGKWYEYVHDSNVAEGPIYLFFYSLAAKEREREREKFPRSLKIAHSLYVPFLAHTLWVLLGETIIAAFAEAADRAEMCSWTSGGDARECQSGGLVGWWGNDGEI